MQFIWDRLSVLALAGTTALALTGCNQSDDHSSQQARNPLQVTISGSVGDGPVANANLELTDALGAVVATGAGDAGAGYRIVVPALTAYPVTLRSVGGTDIVTGREPDVPLELTIGDPKQIVGNLSPLSTFAARAATCATARPNSKQLRRAWTQVLDQLGMGFDAERLGNPSAISVNAVNAADLVLASEGLAETVRRATASLQATSTRVTADQLIDIIACDLAADDVIDGEGGASSVRIAATFRAASAGVLLEMAAKQLRVDGANAMPNMDGAIAQTASPGAVATNTSDVAATPELIRQARDALVIFQDAFADDMLARFVAMFDQMPIAVLPGAMEQALAPADLVALSALSDRVALADDDTLARSMVAARQLGSAGPPAVSFAAVPEQVQPGGAARLSWASAQSARCRANGGWSGNQAGDGTLMTPALVRPVTYRLDCTGLGGTTTKQLTVGVAGVATHPAPTVDLATTADTVASGRDLTLSWTSTDASSCVATDAWTGSKAPDGSAIVGPILANSHFTLTCTGPGGSASDGVAVAIGPAIVPPPTPTPPPPVAPPPAQPPSTPPVAGPPGATPPVQPPVQPPSTPPAATPPAQPPPPASVAASLNASPGWLSPGQSTVLSWTSTGATMCNATGSWTGARATSGSATAGPISTDATFSLSCSGPGGNAIASTTVSTRTARLSWQTPAGVVDPASISGFRIDYGTAPGNYGAALRIADGTTRSTTLTLSPGTYYFAMSALDRAGSELARSNEASKTIN